MKLSITLLATLAAVHCMGGGITTWTETPDAGHLPSTADITIGGPLLTEIDGKLSDGVGGADMYEIYLYGAFTISTVDIGGVADPSLYLFDSSGDALFADDTNNTADPFVQASLSGTVTPGLYYVLITPQGNEPENSNVKLLFDDSATSGQVDANSIKNLEITRFSKGGNGDKGAYEIVLTGAGFAEAPEPGTVFLMGGGVLLLGMFKRLRAR